MKPLLILNRPELDTWINNQRRMGCDLVSVKGKPPKGSTYSDGEPITKLVNIAWKNVQTGETMEIVYYSWEL